MRKKGFDKRKDSAMARWVGRLVSAAAGLLLAGSVCLSGSISARATEAPDGTGATFGDLQVLINQAINDGSTLTLDKNYTAGDGEGRLSIAGTVTIDLYGHTINRALNSATTDGQVIYIGSSGNLTIQDTSYAGNGCITGGKVSGGNGGGVCVDGGSFTMNGGTISGNTAYFGGGGVYVGGDSSTFTMTGGTICNNRTSDGYGGGVNISGSSFAMEGGLISGNRADEGDELHVEDTSTAYMTGGTIGLDRSSGIYGPCSTVYIKYATFTMSGGKITTAEDITSTLSTYTVKVDVDGIFCMTGGEISGITYGSSFYRLAVHLNHSTSIFQMSGGKITGNDGSGGRAVYSEHSDAIIKLSGDGAVVNENGVMNNIYLLTDQTIDCTGLTGGDFAISLQTYPDANDADGTPFTTTATVNFANGMAARSIFSSDNSSYMVSANSAGQAVIKHTSQALSFNVTFDANGGTGSMAGQTYTEAVKQAITANVFTREGYTFAGWNTASDGSGTSYTDGQQVEFAENTTLYAQWTLNSYTVTFNANGHGTAPTAQTVNHGAKATEPAALTATGYTFGGWYTEAACTNAYDFDTTISGDITLYAKWTEAEPDDDEDDDSDGDGDDDDSLSEEEILVRAFVTRMYEKALMRDPDQAGLEDWVAQLLDHTQDGAGIARGFFLGAEYLNRSLSDADYVTNLYVTIFDRTPDQGGYDFWLNALEAGESRTHVLAGFVNSEEFGNLCDSFGIAQGTMYDDGSVINAGIRAFVERMYRYCLKREGEEEGIEFWTGKIASGELEAGWVASQGFFTSQEYLNLDTSDAVFVTDLYAAMFGREPDQGGYDYWMEQLSSGTDRLDVIRGFTQSQEFWNMLAEYGL